MGVCRGGTPDCRSLTCILRPSIPRPWAAPGHGRAALRPSPPWPVAVSDPTAERAAVPQPSLARLQSDNRDQQEHATWRRRQKGSAQQGPAQGRRRMPRTRERWRVSVGAEHTRCAGRTSKPIARHEERRWRQSRSRDQDQRDGASLWNILRPRDPFSPMLTVRSESSSSRATSGMPRKTRERRGATHDRELQDAAFAQVGTADDSKPVHARPKQLASRSLHPLMRRTWSSTPA